MAGQLASVPEFGEWHNRDPAQSTPLNLYRDLIRNVAVLGVQHTRQSANSGSSYSNSSGASSSYCSSGSAASASAASPAEFCADDNELTKIARRMVKDGYAWRMVNEFSGGGPDRRRLDALKTWFLELDVDWVLQLYEGHGSRSWLLDKTASWLQEMTERWIRALIGTAVSMAELVLVVAVDETLAVARFGYASMIRMLVFVDIIIPALKKDFNLQTLVDMYVCVSTASYRFASCWFMPWPISPEAQTILKDIGRSLSREVISLGKAISNIMEGVRTLVERDDDSWPRGLSTFPEEGARFTGTLGGWWITSITSMVKAEGSMRNTAQSHDTANLRGLIDDSVRYLKDLLLRKSEHSSDPSLRYLFILNNFYSLEQLSEPRPGDHSVLPHECKKFTDTYLDVSWGHVLSHIRETGVKDTCLDVSCRLVLLCIPKTGFHEWRQHRKKTSSLAKFESAFHKTYQAQKFWKVPDPQLRDMLRKAITEKVISEYRNYLTKHPKLEKYVSSSPDMMKEMVGDLFEG